MHDADKKYYGHGLPYLKVGPLRGSLIVVEGTDGVGRSTQIELLKSWLVELAQACDPAALPREFFLARDLRLRMIARNPRFTSFGTGVQHRGI